LTQQIQSELELAWQCQLDDLVTGITCAPNGRGWAASSAAGEIIWNAGLTEIVVLQAADGYSIAEISFSADSRWLAAGGQAGQLLIWNCDDPQLPPQLVHKIDFDEWIEHLVWHPTEPDLAISYGAQVQICNVLTATPPIAWKFDKSSVFDLAWHPAGAYLAVAGYKGVQIWSPGDSTLPNYHVAVDTATLKLAWSEDGRYLAAGNLDRSLTIVDWQHPDDPWTLQGCPGKIRELTWIGSMTIPALAVASGTAIAIWKLTSDGTMWDGRLLEGHQGIVTALKSPPHAPILASSGADGYTCLWSAQGEIDQILNHQIVSEFTTLAWHPQLKYLATGSQTGLIELWAIPA
jgi:WD40 repeat protein